VGHGGPRCALPIAAGRAQVFILIERILLGDGMPLDRLEQALDATGKPTLRVRVSRKT